MTSLQDRYAPRSICFGCGPANSRGLRIKSVAEGDEVICDWRPEPYHHAFQDVLNGGITGTIMDCHSNWTAVHSMMRRDGVEVPPPTVTAEFTLRLLRPTPMGTVLHLRGTVLELDGGRAVVETRLVAEGKERAIFRGTFVAVKEGHPAFARWRGP